MTLIATGVFKKVFMKRQAGKGVVAPAGPGGSARSVRRVTSTLGKGRANYTSAEVNESQQVRDMRLGVGAVSGSITGELSVGGYQLPMESILRKVAAGPATTGVLATISAASTGDRSGTFTRVGGSFLADGFKIGDVVRPDGFTTTGLGNNGRNFIITALTATVMTVFTLVKKTQVAAKAAGDNVTIVTPGKKIWTPETGQTRDYYTIEHFFGDLGKSEVFEDCVFTGMNIALPPSGMATIELPVMGIEMNPADAQYFVAPASAPNGAIVAAVNGVVIVSGEAIALLTGLTINVAGGYAYPDQNGVVGDNAHADVSPGVLAVTGQATILFANTVYRDKFLNEEEVSIAMALTANNTPGADFVAFNMSRVKFTNESKDDAQTGLTQTLPFQALENMAGGAALANLQTTLSIQDSSFV